MDFEKYTDRSRGFIQSAQSLALRDGHQQFTPEHLLKVLLDDPEGSAAGLIERSGGRSRKFQRCRAAEQVKCIWLPRWRACSTKRKRSPRKPETAMSPSSGSCWR